MSLENSDLEKSSAHIYNGGKPKSSFRRQILAALIGCTNGFLTGLNIGYTSVGLDSLETQWTSGNAPFQVTNKDIGLFGSSLNLASMVGAVVAGTLSTRYGRKWPNIVLLVPCAVGWLLMVYPSSFYMMLAGQILCGLAQGIRAPIGRVYMGEVAHPEYRGQFLSSIFMLVMAGSLFTYIFALFLDWQALAILHAAVSLVLIPMQIFIPESHVWLISKGRTEEARKAFQWFRGDNYPCEDEFAAAVSHYKETKKAMTSIRDVMNFAYLKPVIILIICMLIRHFSGNTAIMFFMSQILKLAKSGIDPKYAVIVLGIVQLVFIIISGRLMDKFGRKKATVVSSVLMGFSQIGMGLYFYCEETPSLQAWAERFNWLPLVLLSASEISYSLGIASIIIVLSGEIVPLQIRDTTNGILNFFNKGFAFVSLETFHYFLVVAKPSGTFWMFSVCCFVLAGFFLVAMPETKGESLEDIEKKLTGGKLRKHPGEINLAFVSGGVGGEETKMNKKPDPVVPISLIEKNSFY